MASGRRVGQRRRRLCESIVDNPIIYRLVPRPSRFETRQYSLPLLTHLSAIKADPTSQRMPSDNCCAVPSQQLSHVLCGAVA